MDGAPQVTADQGVFGIQEFFTLREAPGLDIYSLNFQT